MYPSSSRNSRAFACFSSAASSGTTVALGPYLRSTSLRMTSCSCVFGRSLSMGHCDMMRWYCRKATFESSLVSWGGSFFGEARSMGRGTYAGLFGHGRRCVSYEDWYVELSQAIAVARGYLQKRVSRLVRCLLSQIGTRRLSRHAFRKIQSVPCVNSVIPRFLPCFLTVLSDRAFVILPVWVASASGRRPDRSGKWGAWHLLGTLGEMGWLYYSA